VGRGVSTTGGKGVDVQPLITMTMSQSAKSWGTRGAKLRWFFAVYKILKKAIVMLLIVLEALGALLVLALIVWWTMFSGRKNGELPAKKRAPDETVWRGAEELAAVKKASPKKRR
jgi:hypothetical protein